jgi:hypothetical protein
MALSSAAPFLLLLLDQPRHAIERNPAVIPDDAPAAIGVGQPREDVRTAAGPDVSRVGVEYTLVVRLAILAELPPRPPGPASNRRPRSS